MRYISEDNKVFETEQECLEHENMVKYHSSVQQKQEKIKEERWETILKKEKEIDVQIDDLRKLKDKFYEDYPEVIDKDKDKDKDIDIDKAMDILVDKVIKLDFGDLIYFFENKK